MHVFLLRLCCIPAYDYILRIGIVCKKTCIILNIGNLTLCTINKLYLKFIGLEASDSIYDFHFHMYIEIRLLISSQIVSKTTSRETNCLPNYSSIYLTVGGPRTPYKLMYLRLECAFANVTPAFLPVLCFLEIANQHNDYKRCNSSVS